MTHTLGRYYDYDASGKYQSKSIQADQLAGHFYLVASNLPSYVPPEHVASTLKAIYDNCVMAVYNGYKEKAHTCIH